MKPRKTIFLLMTALLLASCSSSPQSASSSAASSISSESLTSSSSNASSPQVSSEVSTEPSVSSSSTAFSYETSSVAGSSSSASGEFDWNVDLSLFGEQFLVSLGSKINQTRTKTLSDYHDTLAVGAKAAAYPNENSSTFIPFYHEAKPSEVTTIGDCNREHTWPNSRGGGSKRGGGNIEKDPIMVRPTLTKENSDRSNFFYGLNGKSAPEWDPASCGYEGARGESARVIFYVVTCYAKTNNLKLTNNPKDATSERSMGTLKTLLKWNHDYPPTDFERLVNERYAKMGHARNAFVDHPEYADYIYDEDGFRSSAYVAA